MFIDGPDPFIQSIPLGLILRAIAPLDLQDQKGPV